jgi:iron complex transport system ATP-binding protein
VAATARDVKPPLLAAGNLRTGIGGRVLCESLSMRVAAGEVWTIVGPNGAGKTTLLRTLAGLVPALAGTIAIRGVPLATLGPRERARLRAVLPQDDTDAFATTALDCVLAARHPHLAWYAWESERDRAIAQQALATFGVDALAARDVRTLSGGERRRVALAELLAQQTPLLLLDEPSSHLDIGQQVAALDALTTHARDGARALVMVLHDLHLAARYADHVVTIGDGRAEAGSAAAMLTEDRLSALFGRPLAVLGSGRLRTFVPR